jgi:hypothetical protein
MPLDQSQTLKNTFGNVGSNPLDQKMPLSCYNFLIDNFLIGNFLIEHKFFCSTACMYVESVLLLLCALKVNFLNKANY